MEVQTVRTTTDDKIQEELPDKVETLWQNSSEYLNQDERVQLRQLLHKYRDIFTKDEFDIRQFQGVEHTIDTGEAQPIKQRMRRTFCTFCKRRKRTTDEDATGRSDGTKYFRMCVSACVNPKIRW